MKFKNDNFIGIFDSGIGGISVLNSCINLMPYENYVYFADTKNFPYGKKSKNELKNIVIDIVSKLYDKGSKEIIIACNTMSTNNTYLFNQKYKDIKIIGTFPNFNSIFDKKITLLDKFISIDKKDGIHISNHKIKLLIIATTATTKSEYLNNLVKQFEKYIDIYVEPADFIVDAVEKNYLDSENFTKELEEFFKEYYNIDYLLLGCTHFHFAINKIKNYVNLNVEWLSGGDNASNNAYKNLIADHLLNGNSKPQIKIIDYYIDNDKINLYNKLLKPSSHIVNYYKELT